MCFCKKEKETYYYDGQCYDRELYSFTPVFNNGVMDSSISDGVFYESYKDAMNAPLDSHTSLRCPNCRKKINIRVTIE